MEKLAEELKRSTEECENEKYDKKKMLKDKKEEIENVLERARKEIDNSSELATIEKVWEFNLSETKQTIEHKNLSKWK